MKVTDALLRGETPTLSFEFFPPKTVEQEEQLFTTLEKLKIFAPDFVSVTYGAMGTSRERTFLWAERIKHGFGLEPVAHLTCVAATRQSIREQLAELNRIGVRNLLALRGDPPLDQPNFQPPAEGFRYAKELVSFIKKERPDWCLGVAGFPESSSENFLKEKVEAGAEYIISQLFFDNRHFFSFLGRCRQAGITVPIIAGLMPITSYKQLALFTAKCGASIPDLLREKLEKYQHDPAGIRQIGLEQTLAQSKDLLAKGVKGLHFFVMNQSEPIASIIRQLPLKRI